MSDPSYLQPQAAYETAVRDAIRANLGYSPAQCDRAFDGRPPPSAGVIYVSVWSGGSKRRGAADRNALDQIFTVCVTLTARVQLAFDRLSRQRDDLETRLNAIVALGHKDSYDRSILAAANILAGYRDSGDARQISAGLPVGFCEALAWEDTEPVRVVDGSWFWAGSDKLAGLTQTARFGRVRRIQSQATAS